ncbi:MAG: inner membrane protein YpjD [Acidiferrobacterales bacterium]
MSRDLLAGLRTCALQPRLKLCHYASPKRSVRRDIMKYWLVSCLAATLYVVVGGTLFQHFRQGSLLTGNVRITIFVVGFVAVLLHAAILYTDLLTADGLNLALTNAVSLVMWAVALLFLVTALYRPINNLGMVIMPVAALAVLVAWIWPGPPVVLPAGTTLQSAHIVISVLAYGLLTLAVVQSLLLLAQERQLRHRHAGAFLGALPPLETMEHLMFQLIGIGFLLLTLTVITGVFFTEQLFGKPLRFTHHVVLSLLSWVVFATLLLGHWRFGWRGRPAVRWTLGGFTLLALAYFGTKFVMEIILGR